VTLKRSKTLIGVARIVVSIKNNAFGKTRKKETFFSCFAALDERMINATYCFTFYIA
jgi:hypothetical protein